MCGSKRLVKIWNFGKTPLANAYLKPRDVRKKEIFAPLEAYKCQDCHLVQLRHVVDPEVLFGSYLYVSSTSPSFVKHFEEYAETLRKRFKLTKKDLVVDVGSNDGVLLKPLKKADVKVLGIEPAKNIAKRANKEGIPTLPAFFTPAFAGRAARTYGQARVISANNVFAHTDDVDAFMEAVKEMLTPDGVFVFEVQYLKDLLEKNLFDIVYHEHVCYYHLHPLVRFFKKHGLEVFDVERPEVHGGSIRVFVQHETPPSRQGRDNPPLRKGRKIIARLKQLLKEEEKAGLNTLKPYRAFAARIEKNKKKLRGILQKIKKQGGRVAGYGAPAKATTLMYAFGLNKHDIGYIVDDSPFKQGRLMPGTHVPIVSAEALRKPAPHTRGTPKFCIILAWNFEKPIRENNDWFTKAGGKWIVPVPSPRII